MKDQPVTPEAPKTSADLDMMIESSGIADFPKIDVVTVICSCTYTSHSTAISIRFSIMTGIIAKCGRSTSRPRSAGITFSSSDDRFSRSCRIAQGASRVDAR
jgi:hypothetical protein